MRATKTEIQERAKEAKAKAWAEYNSKMEFMKKEFAYRELFADMGFGIRMVIESTQDTIVMDLDSMEDLKELMTSDFVMTNATSLYKLDTNFLIKKDLDRKYGGVTVWDGKDRATEHPKSEDAEFLYINTRLDIENSEHTGSRVRIQQYLENCCIWISMPIELFTDHITESVIVTNASAHQLEKRKHKGHPEKYEIKGYDWDISKGRLPRVNWYGGSKTIYATEEHHAERIVEIIGL